LQKLVKLKIRHPNAKVVAHPECEEAVLAQADYIGSTTGILNYVVNDANNEFIVATEAGILHQMRKRAPHKTFIAAPPDNQCACNDCPHMKLNTLEKIYLCLKQESPEIVLSDDIRKKAEQSIFKMLAISK
jgi:quinolinate synthase